MNTESTRAAQLEALHSSKGAWKLDNHPELAEGGASYVDQIRAEPDLRFEAILDRR